METMRKLAALTWKDRAMIWLCMSITLFCGYHAFFNPYNSPFTNLFMFVVSSGVTGLWLVATVYVTLEAIQHESAKEK